MLDYFPNELDSQQNFGDYLAEVLADLFEADLRTSGDIFYLVGSNLCDYYLERAHSRLTPGSVAHFWGCGARGQRPTEALLSRARICGVRGPLTRDLLELPNTTPLGDPGLLLPILIPKPHYNSGRVLLVPHFYEPDLPAIVHDRATIGFDDLILPHIFSGIEQVRSMVRAIAVADFVMAGSLHAAVIAAAYGVPFCFFRRRHLDLEFKWCDFACSLGFRALHVYTLKQGIVFWNQTRDTLVLPDMNALLSAAPSGLRAQYRSRVGLGVYASP